MGQYYKPINLDKKVYLYSHDYDCGLKLMEHSWVGNAMVSHIEHLLANSWKGDRIVWAGDYMDELIFIEHDEAQAYAKNIDLFNKTNGKDYSIIPNLYSLAAELYTKVDAIDTLQTLGRYIVNHTKKEYVDKYECKDSKGWIVHPLPILTCSGNGRGGGDYHPVDEKKDGKFIGAWAGDSIAIDFPPDGYKKIKPNFFEKW